MHEPMNETVLHYKIAASSDVSSLLSLEADTLSNSNQQL